MRNTFKTHASQGDFVFSIAQIVKRGVEISQTKGGVLAYIRKTYSDLPSTFDSRTKLAEDILIEAGVDYTPIEVMNEEKIIIELKKEYGIDINQSPNHIIGNCFGLD